MNGVYNQIHEQRYEFETNVVHKIPSANYPWSYITQTVEVLFNEEKGTPSKGRNMLKWLKYCSLGFA